jgi:hypothetical protein
MVSGSPLEQWIFLEGEWEGASSQVDEFGEEGIVESSHVFSLELDGRFILGRHESWQGDRPVNKSITLLFYDGEADKFRRKSAFSYGFVNNEVEYYRDDRVIRFNIDIEPVPKMFRGTRWRSFIEKTSGDEVRLGLRVARDGGDFQDFGVTVLTR